MTPQEQERNLSQNIIDSLCHISERPDGWLPHIVFVEEEGEDGYPCYVRYNLLDYHADGTCTLQRPNTDVQETDRELREINVDWLITIWNWYKELCAEQNLSSKEYSRPPFRGGGLQMSHGDNGKSFLLHFIEKLLIKQLDSF